MTTIETATFSREDYIELLKQVVTGLSVLITARDIEIEEFKIKNESEFKTALQVLKNNYFEYVRELASRPEVRHYRSSFRDTLNANITTAVVRPLGVKEVQTPKKQGFWASLFLPVEYETTFVDEVVEREIQMVETFNEYWERWDKAYETPTDATTLELLDFYTSALTYSAAKYGSFTYNAFNSALKNITADLNRVMALPDAEITITGAAVVTYTSIIDGTFKDPNNSARLYYQM